jgi:hypothetical protein
VPLTLGQRRDLVLGVLACREQPDLRPERLY